MGIISRVEEEMYSNKFQLILEANPRTFVKNEGGADFYNEDDWKPISKSTVDHLILDGLAVSISTLLR